MRKKTYFTCKKYFINVGSLLLFGRAPYFVQSIFLKKFTILKYVTQILNFQIKK